jgi:hypothetical protein
MLVEVLQLLVFIAPVLLLPPLLILILGIAVLTPLALLLIADDRIPPKDTVEIRPLTDGEIELETTPPSALKIGTDAAVFASAGLAFVAVG